MTLLNKIIHDINGTNLCMFDKNIFSQIHHFSSEKNQVTSYRMNLRIDDSNLFNDYFIQMFKSNNFLALFDDASMVSGYYKFKKDNNELIEACLEFIPNPGFQIDQDYIVEDVEKDKLLSISHCISKYIRIEYDCSPDNYKPIIHPCSHIHFGLETDFRIAIHKFPFYSEFINLILFYNYNNKWKSLLPKKKEPHIIEYDNLDFDSYLISRKKDKVINFITSTVKDVELEFYNFCW